MAQSPCVCNTLRMATRAVTQLYDDVLRPSGLRVTQFSILAAIARLGEAGVSQLADALAIEQTTMTRSLTPLMFFPGHSGPLTLSATTAMRAR